MKIISHLILVFASISFIVVIGGAVYEHLAIVPVWTSAVPASLAMMNGDHAITPPRFWIPIHPITVFLLFAGLLLNLKTQARNYVLITVIGYIVVLVVTFLFFVPELLALTQVPYANVVDPDLTKRAAKWELLSLIRLTFMFILAVILLFGLTKLTVKRSACNEQISPFELK